MIYGFAQQFGDQVRIYSEVGAGTMVCLDLTRQIGEVDTSPEEANGAGGNKEARSGCVLVIDVSGAGQLG